MDLFVLLQQHLHLLIPLQKVSRHNLDYTQDSSLIEIADETLSLLWNG